MYNGLVYSTLVISNSVAQTWISCENIKSSFNSFFIPSLPAMLATLLTPLVRMWKINLLWQQYKITLKQEKNKLWIQFDYRFIVGKKKTCLKVAAF